MAMLAGPRVKQKVINLRAKNNAWSNDKNKFGQKMLEKMGWSEGKGLGVKENGIVEHVVARYKNDDRGLGYVDRNDQWTKHEDDFNAILANLSNATNNEDIVPSGNSLEKKSKKSKARIHYHKFTRGKDLSRYSEKDLANIFGKKSLKNIESSDDKNSLKEEINQKEQVFTEKGSMDEYFKKKIASLKIKRKISSENCGSEDQNIPDYCFQGFNASNDDVNLNSKVIQKSLDTYVSNGDQKIVDAEELEVKRKKKKKSKHSEQQQYVCKDNDVSELPNETNNGQQQQAYEKESMNNADIDNTSYETNCDLDVKRKKKKKSKNKEKHLQSCDDIRESLKNKYSEVENSSSSIVGDVEEPVKKKKKKAKCDVANHLNQENEVYKIKKKNK